MKMRLFQLMSGALLVAVALAYTAPAWAEEKAVQEKAAVAAEKPPKPKLHRFTGTIEAVNATSITLKNVRGETKTFTLTADTKVRKADKPQATIADLQVGEKVLVMYWEDGTVKSICPPPPKKGLKPKKEGAPESQAK